MSCAVDWSWGPDKIDMGKATCCSFKMSEKSGKRASYPGIDIVRLERCICSLQWFGQEREYPCSVHTLN